MILTEADFANLSLLPARPELQRMLEQATVVSSDAIAAGIVTMNTEMVLCDEATGERRVVRVVYPRDADPARNLISVLEPLGMALLGAQPGQTIDCDGQIRLRLEKLVYQPEGSLRDHLVTHGLRRP